MHTISADQTAKTVEADQKFNIFAVQLWCKGLIQKWILWLAHKSWGSVFKNSCCFQPPVWLSSRHSGLSVACMIWYLTSEGGNIEGLGQVWQNKLYRGVTIMSCLFCGIRAGWCRAVWMVTRLNQREVLAPVPSCQSEMMRRCLSSRWCLFSPGLLSLSVQPQRGGWHSSVTSLVVLDPRKPLHVTKVSQKFLCLCLPHSHTEVHEGLGFALVRAGTMALLFFCTPGQLWRCGTVSVPALSPWSCSCGGTVSWWHSPALLCVAVHLPQGPASSGGKNLRYVTHCPTVNTRNISGTPWNFLCFPKISGTCRSNSSSPLYMHGVLGMFEDTLSECHPPSMRSDKLSI